MAEKQDAVAKVLNRPITRRRAIKSGGIAIVGLAFVKPAIDTIFPKPAFAQYVTAQGHPSIEWQPPGLQDSNLFLTSDGGGDGIELVALSIVSSYVVRANLCNVSDSIPVTIDDWSFTTQILEGPISSVTLSPDPFPSLTAGPPDDCNDLFVTINTSSPIWEKLKVRVFATGTATSIPETAGPVRLTIEIVPP